MVHLGHDDYVGLHRRYQQMLGGFEPVITLSDDERSKIQQRLSKAFRGMMSALFRQKGATLDIHILTSGEAQHFISTHASILDSTFREVRMSDIMRRRLTDSDYIFSGIKTFHELNEAFPSLLDENGVRKPFERFLNDVQSIDKTYNQHYLRAEYNFAHASASMAAKWEQIAGDGDRYNLQYRTAGDDHVRPEHAALAGVTLPPSDPFWASYYPPNGWNCRCTAVQVRRDKYPETPHDEAMNRGEQALKSDKKGFFRFNSGIARKTFPDYNPYTIRRCRDCDIAKGKVNLAKPMDNELCEACRLIRLCQDKGFSKDKEFGDRLLISNIADKTELAENRRAAGSLLKAFPDIHMKIRPHILEYNKPNPEYEIDGLIADRKGIENPQGITAGFKKAIKQGCQVVVIDLDKHPNKFKFLPTFKMASAINNRYRDFQNDTILECYVVYNNKAIRISKEFFSDDKQATKELIRMELEKISGGRSHP